MKTNAKGFQRGLNEKFILGMNILQESLLEGRHTELYMYPYLLRPSLPDITVVPGIIVLDSSETDLEFYSLSSLSSQIFPEHYVLDIVWGKGGGATLFPQRPYNTWCNICQTSNICILTCLFLLYQPSLFCLFSSFL